MQLTHNFTVPAGIEQAWEVLLDIERVAPCMPGAALETVDGDHFTGSVKVRLGPIGLTYKGKASFVEKDAAGRRAVIDAQAKDARGNGTAKARITATLTPEGSGTAVQVVTDLSITGKPAQFGRGVMVDVGNKLIGQFADCLAGKLSGPDAGGSAAAGSAVVDVAVIGEPDPDTVERLAAADLEGAEQLGTADPDTAEVGVSAPGVVEAGLADLQTPSVTADSAVAGPGLADPEPGAPAAAEAVVALAGPAPDEAPVEPSAAVEAAPPAQRLSDATSPGRAAQPASGLKLAPPPAQRPAVADVEPIDLLGSAGPALARRLAPVLAGALLVVLVLLRQRRRRAASCAATRQARAEFRAAVQRWAEAERQAAMERRSPGRTATAAPPRPAPDWRAWPALRSGDRPTARARRSR